MSACLEDDSDCHNVNDHNSSVLELAGECFTRVLTGDWSKLNEDLLILSVITVTFLASWYFAFCTLQISSLWRRAGAGLRARTYVAVTNNATESPGENSLNQRIEPANPDEPVREELRLNADQVDVGEGSDFRAAGDGWEGDVDVEFIVDEDLLLQAAAGFSDEDSDDDAVMLRQIIMQGNDSDVPEPASQDEPQIVEIIEPAVLETAPVAAMPETVAEDVVQQETVGQVTEASTAGPAEESRGEDAVQTPTNEGADASSQQE